VREKQPFDLLPLPLGEGWGEGASGISLWKGSTIAAVLAHLDGKIAKWWTPDDVVFVESLPMTATGKIYKLGLRQVFKDYQLPA
jgi:acyl-coenzyme A synthetase/AMP-(fatty) acid ligase